jgi:putative DNA methylase
MTTQLDADSAGRSGNGGPPGTVPDVTTRLIDIWFPCPEVDIAVGTPVGSGLSEKALFTWFASRPIAQARAAVLCSLLPDTTENRADIKTAVLTGDESAMKRLRGRIAEQYGSKPPVVLDMFSGRGILPLEAARAGASAIGTDLSPVATLAGRLLADYPLRDWSAEPLLPYSPANGLDDEEDAALARRRPRTRKPTGAASTFEGLEGFAEPRLLADVRTVLAEVGRRVAAEVAHLYAGNPSRGGQVPWAYLWAVTIPCDACKRRFPLIGSMVLRHPYKRTQDKGQSLKLVFDGDKCGTKIHEGAPQREATFTAPVGKRGKSARCPFPGCGESHSLDVVKAKGCAGQYADVMLAVAEIDPDTNRKIFRVPRPDEVAAADAAASASLEHVAGMTAVPEEVIGLGNSNTIQASVYGYTTYGSLMNPRQAVLLATTTRVIRDIFDELSSIVRAEYARVLAAYAGAVLPRVLRYSTRGAGLRVHGRADGSEQNRNKVSDIFASQSVIKHQFDYLETGPGAGPGTWTSVSVSLVNALKKVLEENLSGGRPGKFRRESAVALPFRDNTVDVLVTDPPYYDMITYADSSDLFHVWLKRALATAMPDLFDGGIDGKEGLQDKADEIIVKSKGRRVEGEHRTQDFYESMLARSFAEARRVLKFNGHLTVIFGHSDPEAWKRLLAALTDAGFVVTSSWPSRTETAVTGVATISVTVSIGARVAPGKRPVGIAAQVDAEVIAEVKARCRGWDTDGLALEDQLMASYGAALQIVGSYEKIITPDGSSVPLEHYMTLARRAVRDAVALRLDELPLETFDPHTRLAIFWHEVHGRLDVPKGEARFFVQSDGLRLEDLRGPILAETKAGFRLRHDTPNRLTPSSSVYEVVRGLAASWSAGTEAVAACLATAERSPTDAHVWALVDWLTTKLPTSDPVTVALAAVKRNRGSIQANVATKIAVTRTAAAAAVQPSLFEETQ